MKTCESCGKKIGFFAVRYTWVDKKNNRAMHDKCYKKYMSESPEKRASDKIQTPEMEKDIERTKDISEAMLQGGKAVGEIARPKKKKNKK